MADRDLAEHRADLAALADAEAPSTDRLAAVRRLLARADDRPELRQPVADAICAHLRATAPLESTVPVLRATGPADRSANRPADRPANPPADRPAAGTEGTDERETDLRRAALDLLAARLRPGGPGPWPEIDLDLSGTTLVDVDLRGCELAEGRFADTRFVGTASFEGASFDGDALFPRTVFEGDARFDGVRFGGEAVFGRARFRGVTGFAGARFDAIAWFGRGEETLWEDDPAWEAIEELSPLPWDEPNETDPQWPVAVLIEDYQDWEEGGDGARFAGPVSFRGAHFGGPAWFYQARFGAVADFREAGFTARVHLDQPAVRLTGAHWSDENDDGYGETYWPLGWAVESGTGRLVPDDDVHPYAGQLGDPDPEIRRAGLRRLAVLGDSRPELRQRVVDALCAYLRTPLPFRVTGDLDPGQAEELRLRREVQQVLADRLRPATEPYWPELDLQLCGATLVELDLSGGAGGYADFVGAQFHGSTSFAGCRFERTAFDLGTGSGVATFHGPVDVSGARLGADSPLPG
ncbi:pentapeptide repeat-containing protein [Plantactinospora sp. BC1]|uniref:pentapeptide repeat-containing protein n=1 Tax=Plantactinospora sp. BC1 TaxID=2108470 RepID=UPI00131EED8F|nr:pentapeptide repeat-containing protein [Plantactinospora sp. BC1]